MYSKLAIKKHKSLLLPLLGTIRAICSPIPLWLPGRLDLALPRNHKFQAVVWTSFETIPFTLMSQSASRHNILCCYPSQLREIVCICQKILASTDSASYLCFCHCKVPQRCRPLRPMHRDALLCYLSVHIEPVAIQRCLKIIPTGAAIAVAIIAARSRWNFMLLDVQVK